MTRPTADSPGRKLLGDLRRELSEVEEQIRSHRFLAALDDGRVPGERLAAFAGEQHAIISSDRRSFALLASRFPEPPAGDLFLSLAEGEGRALELLRAFAAAVGTDEEALRAHEPAPGAQAYPAFVAWLALNGSRSDVSLALLANLAAWGANCAQVAKALRSRYGLEEEAVAFFTFFAEPPPDSEQRLLAVLDEGLGDGDSPVRGRRAARLLQAYELLFWDTLAEEIA
ncbi:MAG: transcriptional regulator [Solirubrobacteraceae bacterium]